MRATCTRTVCVPQAGHTYVRVHVYVWPPKLKYVDWLGQFIYGPWFVLRSTPARESWHVCNLEAAQHGIEIFDLTIGHYTSV